MVLELASLEKKKKKKKERKKMTISIFRFLGFYKAERISEDIFITQDGQGFP